MRVWPSGWVCHAVRAPGSKVTRAPDARDGSFAWNRGSMRTEPLKYSGEPGLEGCEPFRVMVIICARWFDPSTRSDSAVTMRSFIPPPGAKSCTFEANGKGAGRARVAGKIEKGY